MNQPPLPEITAEPGFLVAHGDEHQLVVSRSPLVRDTDQMMYAVLEHRERFGMQLVDQRTETDPAWWFGQCEMSWYAVPQLRMGFIAHAEGKLP